MQSPPDKQDLHCNTLFFCFVDKTIKITLPTFSDFLHTTFPHYLFTSGFTYNPAGTTTILSVINIVKSNRYGDRANSKY